MAAPRLPLHSAHELRGRLGRILFQRDGASHVLAVFHPQDGRKIVVSGAFTEADQHARELTLSGRWVQGTKGPIFQVGRIWRGVSATLDEPPEAGIIALLAELVPGFGPAKARRLVEALRPFAWAALTREPYALAAHVGLDRALEINRRLIGTGLPRVTALAHLLSLGLSWAYAQRVLDALGTNAIAELARDPYRMIGIKGIRFATADRIARTGFGVTAGDPRRLKALAVAVLEEAADAGHTSLPEPKVHAAIEALAAGVTAGMTPRDIVAAAVADGLLIADLGDLYLPRLYHAERRAAERLAHLTLRPPRDIQLDIEHDPDLAGYTPEQKQAIRLGLTAPVVLITGRPGTGKTTVAAEIVRLAQDQGIPIHLAATTGKAAARLTESLRSVNGPRTHTIPLTVDPARTIHSLVGTELPGRPLPRGIVVIDEWSMGDLPLAARVLENCGPHTSLVFLGDPNQLPPVVAGNSARDLRDSGVVSTVELHAVHRQDRSSLIAINADRVLDGKMPLFYGKRLFQTTLQSAGLGNLTPEQVTANCYFQSAPSPVVGAEKVVKTVLRLRDSTTLRPNAPGQGYDPVRDILVFSPMKPKFMGTYNLNRLLQEALNPHGAPIRSMATLRFRALPPELPESADGRLRRTAPAGYVPRVGDTIEMTQAIPGLGLQARDRGTVIAHTAAGGIRIRVGTGAAVRELDLAPRQFDRFKLVYELMLRVGDPVLHTANDAARRTTDGRRVKLFNGMRGYVVERLDEGGCVVEFPDVGRVAYTHRQTGTELAMDWCRTGHKGQGMEAPVSIAALHHAEHKVMLDRSWFYVALTRAQEQFVCVGTPQAIHMALREEFGKRRHTRLAERTARRVQELRAAAAAQAQGTAPSEETLSGTGPGAPVATRREPLFRARTSAMLSETADPELAPAGAGHPEPAAVPTRRRARARSGSP